MERGGGDGIKFVCRELHRKYLKSVGVSGLEQAWDTQHNLITKVLG